LAAEVALKTVEHRSLKKAALLIEREAKSEIGHYQGEVGPFPAWAALADSTEAQKARMGYPAGAPLLATGAMRDNITHEISGHEAVVGSPDEKAVYHEFGTSKMPPRPVFGPAAFKSLEKLHNLIGAEVVAGIIDGKVAHGGADYLLGR
jgi:HK97 gp10 family phage protein